MKKVALLSVSDKTGLIELAQRLVQEFKFELISSGGTAQILITAGLPVTKVSDYTGSPEILGGRVKTLHPKIHGGILARQDLPSDLADLAAQGIDPIALVVVNLYPFTQTIQRSGVTLAEAIENIDIGGPTLLRASAKNHAHLSVLCRPDQYAEYVNQLATHGGEVPLAFRQTLALQAFEHTANYDRAIVSYLSQTFAVPETPAASSPENPLPDRWTLTGEKVQSLRYGENPHQAAAWYQLGDSQTGWTGATQLQGKELSYNNLVDLEAARLIAAEFMAPQDRPTAVVVKHNNPCGVASGNTLSEAYQRAFDADPISAFGGIIALNQTIEAETATALTQTFLECVVAPGCTAAAQAILQGKKNLRVLILPDLSGGLSHNLKTIAGGFLLQEADRSLEIPEQWQIVTEQQPTPDQTEALYFAWKVAKHVKSNAIVIAQAGLTLGIGAGQMNRVGSVHIALTQAGDRVKGAVLASDAFFPFDDSVRSAATAGISAIIQPGGSIRDQDSIQAANELGLAMVFTGIRHFLH
jgi:phosphoribosylaminoimidazolecarboxamide formyltransferase/IMP cyclohydrolase